MFEQISTASCVQVKYIVLFFTESFDALEWSTRSGSSSRVCCTVQKSSQKNIFLFKSLSFVAWEHHNSWLFVYFYFFFILSVSCNFFLILSDFLRLISRYSFSPQPTSQERSLISSSYLYKTFSTILYKQIQIQIQIQIIIIIIIICNQRLKENSC